jgi:hypothetical protein
MQKYQTTSSDRVTQLTSIRFHLTCFPLKAQMAFRLQKSRGAFERVCKTYEKINNSRIKGLDFKT